MICLQEVQRQKQLRERAKQIIAEARESLSNPASPTNPEEPARVNGLTAKHINSTGK